MLRLNRAAAEVAHEVGARGATDITGFGLLGHIAEMVDAAEVGVSIDSRRLPFLDGALMLAEKAHWSGGMRRNRRHVETTMAGRLSIEPGVPSALLGLLFESETSGGLLFGVPVPRAPRVGEAFRLRGEESWEIGEVTSERGIRVV
jgi:selenide,water dikinase